MSVTDHPTRRPSVSRRVEVAAAAYTAGHRITVERHSGRFRLVCACGWKTSLGWTRKKAFLEVADHQVRAGRTALGETPALGRIEPLTPLPADFDPAGVSLPGIEELGA